MAFNLFTFVNTSFKMNLLNRKKKIDPLPMICQIGIRKHMATLESLSQNKSIWLLPIASLKRATLLLIHLLVSLSVHICNTSFHMLNWQWGVGGNKLWCLQLLHFCSPWAYIIKECRKCKWSSGPTTGFKLARQVIMDMCLCQPFQGTSHIVMWHDLESHNHYDNIKGIS